MTDADRFEAFVREYQDMVFATAVRLLGREDEAEDVALMQGLFERLAAPGTIVTTREAVAVLDREPELAGVNAHLRHKAANLRSVQLDQGIAGGPR